MCVRERRGGQNIWTVRDGAALACGRGVRSGVVMQSQHGVPSTLTAAPMYGQYGDALVLLTATEQAVPALSLSAPLPSSCPHCLSVQRSVKCQNRWRHDTLKIHPPTPKPTHQHSQFTDSNRRLRLMQTSRCAGVCLCMCVSPFMHLCVCVCKMDGNDATTV